MSGCTHYGVLPFLHNCFLVHELLHIILVLSQGWNSLDTVIAAEGLALTLQSVGSLREAQELLERWLKFILSCDFWPFEVWTEDKSVLISVADVLLRERHYFLKITFRYGFLNITSLWKSSQRVLLFFISYSSYFSIHGVFPYSSCRPFLTIVDI